MTPRDAIESSPASVSCVPSPWPWKSGRRRSRRSRRPPGRCSWCSLVQQKAASRPSRSCSRNPSGSNQGSAMRAAKVSRCPSALFAVLGERSIVDGRARRRRRWPATNDRVIDGGVLVERQSDAASRAGPDRAVIPARAASADSASPASSTHQNSWPPPIVSEARRSRSRAASVDTTSTSAMSGRDDDLERGRVVGRGDLGQSRSSPTGRQR